MAWYNLQRQWFAPNGARYRPEDNPHNFPDSWEGDGKDGVRLIPSTAVRTEEPANGEDVGFNPTSFSHNTDPKDPGRGIGPADGNVNPDAGPQNLAELAVAKEKREVSEGEVENAKEGEKDKDEEDNKAKTVPVVSDAKPLAPETKSDPAEKSLAKAVDETKGKPAIGKL